VVREIPSMVWFNPNMARQGITLGDSREQDTALWDNPGQSLSAILTAQTVDALGKKLGEAFTCIRNLNDSQRAQDAVINELRQELEDMRRHTGLEHMKDRLISRATAGKMLGVSSRTLQRWEKSKPLHPVFSSGNRASYSLAEVKRLRASFGSAGLCPGTRDK
jgi:hypothetical protein